MTDTPMSSDVNNAKLFVGNLSYAVTTEDLREVFSQFGEITDCIVLTDKFSGRSKGFGFVTFATVEEAEAAKEGLNEQEYQGRALKVSTAQPPRPREDRGFGGNRRPGGGGFNRGGDRGDRRGGFNRGR